MNSASIRKSTVTLCSVLRIVASCASSSSCESVSKTITLLPSCCSTVWSFQSRKCFWCFIEAIRNHNIVTGSRLSTMSGKGGKSNRKGGRKPGRGKSNNMSPNTEKTDSGENKNINIETCAAALDSKSLNDKSEMEAALANKSTENEAVSEVNPPKTDNIPESLPEGGALSLEKERKMEKTETSDRKSPLKTMAEEEEIVRKPDVKGEENVTLTSSGAESSAKVDVKEGKNKECDNALKQSDSKAVDHETGQPSDKTEDDAMVRSQPELANNESMQVKDSRSDEEIDTSVLVVTDSSDSNNSSPRKGDSASVSIEGKTTPKASGFARETKHQETKTYYGTRQAAVMREREKFLAMTREEKRKFYQKKGFVTLDDVGTWKEFYCKYVKSLKRICPGADQIKTMFKGSLPKFEGDDEINSKISVFEGDITTMEVDGIVNAANAGLLGGGGVDGAIHHAAGSQLVEECRTLGGCKTGDAKTTCAYKLPAKYVIHTVGPQGTYPQDLRSCYTRCLDEMLKHNMRSIAFCCISTGIYGYPNDMAVHVALSIVRDWFDALKQKNQLNLVDRVVFCLFMRVDIRLYHAWMQVYFPQPGVNDADKSVSEETKGNKGSSDSDCPTAEGKEEDERKSSKGGDESASMEVEETVVATEEDMDAEDGAVSSERAGGAESPDKKCKLDPDATTPSTVAKMDMC